MPIRIKIQQRISTVMEEGQTKIHKKQKAINSAFTFSMFSADKSCTTTSVNKASTFNFYSFTAVLSISYPHAL